MMMGLNKNSLDAWITREQPDPETCEDIGEECEYTGGVDIGITLETRVPGTKVYLYCTKCGQEKE